MATPERNPARRTGENNTGPPLIMSHEAARGAAEILKNSQKTRARADTQRALAALCRHRRHDVTGRAHEQSWS
jgi:hypothetical protein